jgi:RNA polymerase sigma-70 factor (ECF subfamily)
MANMALMQPEQASAALGSETIEELFAALESPLLGYALRLTGEIAAAEDLVQEAFMNLQAQFQSVRQPRRWLYRTVHNLALNHRRQSAKIVPLQPAAPDDSRGSASASDPADPKPLPDEQLIRLEGIGLVRLTLDTLDARSRELIRLKFNDELSYKEIAARTGLSIGNVGYILHCALKQMAVELAKDGVIP